jgi:hypothetical protein
MRTRGAQEGQHDHDGDYASIRRLKQGRERGHWLRSRASTYHAGSCGCFLKDVLDADLWCPRR